MIIGNGKIITNDASNPFIENGAVYISDNMIKEVGTTNDIKTAHPQAEFHDARGMVIMPGMINSHTHIYSAFARGMAVSGPGNDFGEILEHTWWKLDRKLALEDCKLNAYTTYIESIRNGVTTVIDHHSSPYAAENSLFVIAEAAKDLGIRTSLCYEVSDRDGEEILEKEIKENIDFIKHTLKDDNGDMIKGLFGLHASFTVSEETLEKCTKAMQGLDAGYHVHVAEGYTDQVDSVRKYGKRIVERFEDAGILGPKTIAVHCIHTNKREWEILRDTDTNVAHNPESNMGNAVGASPVVQMLQTGVRVGLGTDAYTNDMFESMKVANILQRHHNVDPTVGFMDAINMQLVNNPLIVANYFNQPLGVIKPGAYADIITVDYHPMTPLNGNNTFGHILFGFQGAMVQDTMINGKFVMKNRQILPVDAEKIYADSAAHAAKIWPGM